jgi:dihydrofolate reductase/thymidylate synthase
MSLSLIASVIFDRSKNKFAIGSNNNLIYYLKDDLKYFRNITQTIKHKDTKLNKNIILMGTKTWYSIPSNKRPLNGRINFVLTNNNDLLKTCPLPMYKMLKYLKNINTIMDKNVYFITMNQFKEFYNDIKPNVFIIGGESIYNYFLNENELKPETLYLTEIKSNAVDGKFKWTENNTPTSYMDIMTNVYVLKSVSDKFKDDEKNISYRFLTYKLDRNNMNDEIVYLNVLKDVLENGKFKNDRTKVNTLSKFGKEMTFNIETTVPLITSKYVNYKTVIEELLWFLRGDTDNKILQEKGITIWNGNSSREFLDKVGLNHYKEGICGPIYGWQWRFFGAKYCQMFANTKTVDKTLIHNGFDQIKWVINEIKVNPNSRRLVVSSWNPPDNSKMCLNPCHYSFQFVVEDMKYLNCLVNMRSNDLFLGAPFNIFSYAVLTYIIALKCDLKPKTLKFSLGDAHIYMNHIEQVEQQLKRELRPLPMLMLDQCIKTKEFDEITVDDFEMIGYFPNKFIRGDMAV